MCIWPEIVGHPAPLFHVGEDLPGERLALVGEIGLAQLLELRLLGMQAAHVGGGIGRLGGALDDDLGIDQLRLTVEIGIEQDGRIDDAAAARIAGVLEQRQRDFDVGLADLLRIELRSRRDGGQLEVLGLEAPVAGLEDFGAQRGAVVGQPGLAQPHRRVAARGIEVREDGALFQLLRRAVGRQRVELGAQRAGDRIGVGRRGHGRRDRRVGGARHIRCRRRGGPGAVRREQRQQGGKR